MVYRCEFLCFWFVACYTARPRYCCCALRTVPSGPYLSLIGCIVTGDHINGDQDPSYKQKPIYSSILRSLLVLIALFRRSSSVCVMTHAKHAHRRKHTRTHARTLRTNTTVHPHTLLSTLYHTHSTPSSTLPPLPPPLSLFSPLPLPPTKYPYPCSYS